MRIVALSAAVVFAGTTAGVFAAPASSQGLATSVKITHWSVGVFNGNFFGPSYTVRPGKTFRHCAGHDPLELSAWYTIQGPKHEPVQVIWWRNGRVEDKFRVHDLSNHLGHSGMPDSLRPGLSFGEFGTPSTDGKWSLVIKEFGRVIGSSTVTVASKGC